jgi:hypothetical protein
MKQGIHCWLVLTMTALLGHSQTRINLPYQSRNVDFSMADSTRSFKSGTSLPSSCSVGEQFFKTDAPAGQNFYGCTAANTWTLQSGGGGTGGGLSQGLTDLAVTAATSTVLSVAGGVYGIDGATYNLTPMTFTIRSFSVASVGATNPATVTVSTDLGGAVRNGDTINITSVNGSGCSMFNGTFSAVATGARQLTLLGVNGSGCSYSGGGTVAGTGNGTAYVYGNPSGSVTLEVPASSGVIAVCTGTCIVNQVTSPAAAVNGVPLASVVISAGAWGGVTDLRAFLRARNLTAGTGILVSETGGGATMAIDTALVPQLGGANIWTGSNDFSSASSFRLPPKQFFADYRAADCAGGTATSGLSWGTADAPSAACVLGHTNTVLGVLGFNDTALNAVQGHFSLPLDWTGSIEIRAVWRAGQAAGNVVWGAQAACAGPGESADPVFGEATLATAAASTTANSLSVTSLGPLQAPGCAAGKELFFRFYRDGASAQDTMSGNAELLSLRVAYQRAL